MAHARAKSESSHLRSTDVYCSGGEYSASGFTLARTCHLGELVELEGYGLRTDGGVPHLGP